MGLVEKKSLTLRPKSGDSCSRRTWTPPGPPPRPLLQARIPRRERSHEVGAEFPTESPYAGFEIWIFPSATPIPMKIPAFPLLFALAAVFLLPCDLHAQTTSTFYQSNTAVAPGSAYYISGVITNAVVPASLTLYRLEGSQWVRVNPQPGVTSSTSSPRHGYTFAVNQPGTYMIGVQYSSRAGGAGAFTQPVGVSSVGDRAALDIPVVSKQTAAANNMVWTVQPNQETVPNVTPSGP